MDDTPAAPRPMFSLAGHVRACAMSDQLVLLDLRRSRYLALGLRQWQVLNGSHDDQAAVQHGSPRPLPDRHIEALAAPLLRQGILTREPSRAPADPHTGERGTPAETSLDVRGVTPISAVSATRVMRFLAAAAWSTMALRLCPLSFSVGIVEKRSARLRQPRPDDDDKLRDAAAAFEALRPLLFTARDRCLYDSLALVTFLASEGLAARWVIGVKTRPFAAHSWVQAGSMVLNDLHEHVRSYRPILVV